METLQAIKEAALDIGTISWFVTMIALYGAYLNSKQDRNGFWFWLVSNLSFCLINILTGQYALSFLFGVYTAITINGLVKWNKSPK